MNAMTLTIAAEWYGGEKVYNSSSRFFCDANHVLGLLLKVCFL